MGRRRRLNKMGVLRAALFSVAGVGGGIIIPTSPWLGGILCGIGILGAVQATLESAFKEERLQEQLDLHAGLLAKAGVGNVYLEAVVAELERYGTYDRSWQALLQAVEIAPQSGEAMAHLAVATALSLSYLTEVGITVSREEFRRAEGVAKKAIALSPQDHDAYSALGIIYDSEGKHDAARRLFMESRARGNIGWQVELCTSYMMEGKPEAALKEIEEAAVIGMKLGWPLYFWLGACRMAVGRYEDANAALMAALTLRGYRYGIVRALADVNFRTGRWFTSAQYRIIQAWLIWPVSKSRAVITLGRALAQAGAIASTRLSAAMLPLTRHLGPVFRFQCRHIPPFGPEEIVAMLEWEDGNFEAGLKMMERAIAMAPEWPSLWANKALFLSGLGRFDDASRCLERALESEPDNPLWLQNRRHLELRKAGKLTKSRRRVFDIGRQRDGWFRIRERKRKD